MREGRERGEEGRERRKRGREEYKFFKTTNDEWPWQMHCSKKLADAVKLHHSLDNKSAHAVQSHKAMVALTDGTAHLSDIFIEKKIHHTIMQWASKGLSGANQSIPVP